jgi:pyruvate dehydrogenase E2 component (dihydrolipoamide acetyltransferase)
MAEGNVRALTMPKWGLAMTEGRLLAWLAEEGAALAQGTEVAEVETDKINGVVEAPGPGTLRRRVAREGTVIPVGGLLAAVADASVPDAEVDAFVEAFQASFFPPSEDEAAEEAEKRMATPAGEVRFAEVGEGDEVLVLVHGFGGDLENWAFNLEALADGRRVVAFDLPGHGASVNAVGEDPLGTFRAALGGVLDGLETDAAHLAGHSLGGLVAATFAAEHPERVRSLTLIDTVGLGEEVNMAYIDGFVAARTRRELKPVVELLFADPSLVTRQLLDGLLRYKRLDGVTETLRRVADAAFPGGRQGVEVGPLLERLDVPLLVLWGDGDRIIPAAHAQRAPDRATVATLPGRGHSPHMEAAREVNAQLAGFLAGVPAV